MKLLLGKDRLENTSPKSSIVASRSYSKHRADPTYLIIVCYESVEAVT
jgi:hypothetical protein